MLERYPIQYYPPGPSTYSLPSIDPRNSSCQALSSQHLLDYKEVAFGQRYRLVDIKDTVDDL